MSNIRDPVRDEIKEYYETHKISIKKLAEHFNISENTIKSWKKRDKKNGNDWVQLVDVEGATKGAVADNKKKQIIKAKSMVIAGSTLKETSEKVGIPLSTLGEYSAKENWIDKQEKYMQKVYEELQKELGEIHIYDRKLATKFIHNSLNEVIKKDYEKSINIKDIALKTEIMNFVIKSIKGQSELIGITDIKSLVDINLSEQDLEIKKQKYKDPKGKDKTGSFLDKLEEFL